MGEATFGAITPGAITFDAITPERVEATARLIGPHLRRTPLVAADAAEWGLPPAPLVLKLESLQRSGSFKARGAFANLLGRAVPPEGVVAASGGNHGAAVAVAARRLGIPATIFLPSISSPAKVAAIRAAGARLVVVGERIGDAFDAAIAQAGATGAMFVHAYDGAETILGQGTLGPEIAAQAIAAGGADLGLDTLLVAVGGGGLLAGIAAWAGGRLRLVGVEPAAAPTLRRALEAGRPVDAPGGGVAADSLGPPRIGALAFPILQDGAARGAVRSVLVEDAAIRRAQAALWEGLRVVAEPGGAAAFAALLDGAYRPERGERVGAIVCGGNTGAVRFDG